MTILLLYFKSNSPTYNNIGVVYHKMYNYDLALEYYQQSLVLSSDNLSIATLNHNIGSIFYNKGENDEALIYFRKSLAIRKEFLPPNHPDIEKLYNNMGLIHTNKSEFDEALNYFDEAHYK